MTQHITRPSINTLTVSLQVLQVGNKQMTISVFKQLKSGSFYNSDYEIKDNVWGKVRHDGDWYVIFDRKGELFKERFALNIDQENLFCSHYFEANEGSEMKFEEIHDFLFDKEDISIDQQFEPFIMRNNKKYKGNGVVTYSLSLKKQTDSVNVGRNIVRLRSTVELMQHLFIAV